LSQLLAKDNPPSTIPDPPDNHARGAGRLILFPELYMSEFTPVTALVGGTLIGLAAVVLLGGIGRLAGISNITHALLDRQRTRQPEEWVWRVVFLIGMIGATTAYFALTGQTANPRQNVSPLWLIIGGLLVGYGTSMGNGCTSGHGVCGLGRLSWRSLAATLVFMATGAATVFVVRHVVQL
jgi:hypothetical protein